MLLNLNRRKRSSKNEGQYYLRIIDNGTVTDVALKDSEGNRITDALLARSEFKRLNGLAKRGMNPFTYDKTLDYWLGEFFLAEEATKAPATVRSERELLEPCVKWLMERGVRSPQQVTPALIDDRMIFRLGSQKIVACSKEQNPKCKTTSKQRVSARTVNLERAYLGMLFAYIMTRLPEGPGSILRNPVHAVKPRKTIKKAKRPISEAHLWRLIEYFENPTLVRGKPSPANGASRGLAIRLAVESGLRPAELAAICWEDIDFAEGVLWIRNTEVHTVKDKEDRPIPLTDGTLDRLQRVAGAEDGERIFLTLFGMPFQNAFRLALQNACKKLAIPQIHPYQLRHTFATRALDAGSPIQQVAAVMGHSKITTTQAYAHASDRGRRDAVRLASLETPRVGRGKEKQGADVPTVPERH